LKEWVIFDEERDRVVKGGRGEEGPFWDTGGEVGRQKRIRVQGGPFIGEKIKGTMGKLCAAPPARTTPQDEKMLNIGLGSAARESTGEQERMDPPQSPEGEGPVLKKKHVRMGGDPPAKKCRGRRKLEAYRQGKGKNLKKVGGCAK